MTLLLGMIALVLRTVLGFFAGALLVRTAMHYMRISFVGPLGQFILAVTNWIVRPFHRVLPSIGKLYLPALVPAWLLEALFSVLDHLLKYGVLGNLGPVLVAAAMVGALETLSVALVMLMAMIIVSAILSWVNPYAPIAPILNQLSQPLLRPFRRWIPPIGGVDFSPLVLLLLLQVLNFFTQEMEIYVRPFFFM